MENCHLRPNQLMPVINRQQQQYLQPGAATTMYGSNYTAEDEMIESWLLRIKFGEYICNFIESGYDMGSIAKMTPEDLIAIGITNPNHRRILKTEIQNLGCQLNGRCSLPDLSVAENLYHWLYLIKLEEYHDVLCKQAYNTIDQVVNDLTWEDFEDVGIIKLGHQKRLILAIKKYKKDVSLFDSINSVSVIPPSLDSDYHLIEVKTNPNSSSSTTSSPAVTPSHHSSNLVMGLHHPFVSSTAALIHPYPPSHHGLNDLNVHQSFNSDCQIDDEVGSQVMRIQCGGSNYASSNSLMAVAPGRQLPSPSNGSTSCDSVTAAGGAVGSFINPGSAIIQPPASSSSNLTSATGGVPARPSSMMSFLSTASHYSSSSSGISSTSSASSASSTTSDNNPASSSSQSVTSPGSSIQHQQHSHQRQPLPVQPPLPPPPPPHCTSSSSQFPHSPSQLVNVHIQPQQAQQHQMMYSQHKESAVTTTRPTGIVNPCSLPPVVPMIDDLDEIKRQLKQQQQEQQEMNYRMSPVPHLQRSQSDACRPQVNNQSSFHRNLIERHHMNQQQQNQVYQRPQELVLSSPVRRRNNPPPPPPRRSSPTGSLSNERAILSSSSIYQTPKVTVAPSSSLWALPTSSFLSSHMSNQQQHPSSAASSASLSSVSSSSQTLPTKGRIMKKSIIAAACPNPPVSSVPSSPAATIKKITAASLAKGSGNIATGHSSLDRRSDKNSHQLNSQDDDLNDLIKALDSLSQSLGIEIKSSSLCN